MTSSEKESAPQTWQPEPPVLQPPWHTPEREKLQEQARRFAMDEVLPVADELDPQKGEIPASLLARLAELVPIAARRVALGVACSSESTDIISRWLNGRCWPTATLAADVASSRTWRVCCRSS